MSPGPGRSLTFKEKTMGFPSARVQIAAILTLALAGPALQAASQTNISIVNDNGENAWIVGQVPNSGGGTLTVQTAYFDVAGDAVSSPNTLPTKVPPKLVKTSSCILTFKGKASNTAIIRVSDGSKPPKTHDFVITLEGDKGALRPMADSGNVTLEVMKKALTVVDVGSSNTGMGTINIKKPTF
jgi:hypothetical protein